MKNKKIIISILLLLLINFFVMPNNYVYASGYSISEIFTSAQNFIESGNEVGSMITIGALEDTSTFIYKLLFSIGLVVAVIVGVVLGIQFMISSVMDKAKVKESLVGYVISCVVLFGAFGIWKMVINIVQQTTNVSSITSPGTTTTPVSCTTHSWQFAGDKWVCTNCHNTTTICPHINTTGNGTCTNPTICQHCNKELEALHNLRLAGNGTMVCDRAGCGYYEENLTNCTHPAKTGEGTCKDPKKCAYCGAILEEEHRYSERGTGIFICDLCGDYKE